MKKLLWLIPLIGLYVIKEGIVVLSTKGRGEAIYELGMLITATTPSLIAHGSLFVLAGIALVSVPFILKKLGNL
ncbi:hypothetical protein ACFQ88_05390 [Paenibacillus sp. NPDC056579]|uniref:hypothetical protein n=1 Tax=Paenibacillus sp. NPDC056579 TaxID=3345871 RepID=UPI003691E661